MFVASTGLLRGSSSLIDFQESMTFTRALFSTLGVFTLLVGALWLVRSGASLPSLRSLGEDALGWRLHAAGLIVAAVVAPFALFEGPLRGGSQFVVACGALVAGCSLARWLASTSLAAAQPLAGFSFALVVELTVGWLAWNPETSFGLALLGLVTMVRSLTVITCVLASAYALSAGHWPPVVSTAAGLAERIRRLD